MILRIKNALNTIETLLNNDNFTSELAVNTQLTQNALEGKKRIYQKTKDKINNKSMAFAFFSTQINKNLLDSLKKYLESWYQNPLENQNSRDILVLLDCFAKNEITDSTFFSQITQSTNISHNTIIKLKELLEPEITLEI